MSFHSFAAAYAREARSPAASLPDSIYAERIATPISSKSLPLPPFPTSPLTASSRRSTHDIGGYLHASTADASRPCTGLHTGSLNGCNGGGENGEHTSLSHSFSHPPLNHPLDDEQRRCVNTAFHISFHGNPRVKHKPTAVYLSNGASFLIVDRFVSGNSDGVYDKNRKMWEQIPVGQARVFARSSSSAKLTAASAVGIVGSDEEAAALAQRRSSPPPKDINPGGSGGVAYMPAPQPFPNSHSSGEWACVATAVGLRKMGHWREATTVFAMHKATATSAIALEKVDGESGHVTAFTWEGERYWVVGCRYQHIVTRLDVPETDLVRYATAASISSSSSSTISEPPSAASSSAAPSPEGSPTQQFTGSIHRARQYHGARGSGATALNCGGLSSEAGYLDLAVRMARLWRRVLESLPATEATNTPGKYREGEGNGKTAAVVALHRLVALDRRTLCFDAILTGWERLQTYNAAEDPWTLDEAPATARPVTATSVTSAGSPGTTLPASSTVFPSPSLTGSTTADTEIPLWFYAVTWDASLEARGWCMPVHRARDFFASAHLPCVPASAAVALGSAEYEALRQSVLSRGDTAGAVLYGFHGEADEDGNESSDGDVPVVLVWKCRAYPHTLERVVQEYVVTHRLCGDPLRSKMKKKMSSLSRETRLCIKQWELHRLPFLVDFALWLHREKYITPSTDLASLKHIRGHWLSYQERFKDVLLAQLQRHQQRLSARLSSLSSPDASRKDEQTRGEGAAEDASSASAEDAEDSLDPVMLVGPQGCGKSTLARILYALLEEAGAAPRWLNQDEVGTRVAYLASIQRAMARGTYSHLLLDKMNLDDRARADYDDIGVKPVLVVAWRHTSGTEAMVRACYDRIVQRGPCHRTFYHADEALFASSRSPELQPSVTPPADIVVSSPVSSGGGSGVPAAWLSAAASPVTTVAAAPAFSPSPSSVRLHGILEASAKRYQTPSTLPCVELDVTWGCARAVEVVWAALQEKGSCELPPLSSLHVEEALQSAYAYERLLQAYPARVVTAVLRGPPGEEVLRVLGPCRPPAIPKTLRLQTKIEVLLHDFHLNPSPTALVRYAYQVGTTRRLTVEAVVSNSKVVLLLVLGPSESIAALQTTTTTAAAAVVNAALSSTVDVKDVDDGLEAPTQQGQWAVVAKAKKVTADYCESLAQRVRDDPDEDPYCCVRWLSPPLVMDFELAFTFP